MRENHNSVIERALEGSATPKRAILPQREMGDLSLPTNRLISWPRVVSVAYNLTASPMLEKVPSRLLLGVRLLELIA